MSKSGKDVGADYIVRIEKYLASVPVLPILPSGALSVSAIADGANVPRQSLYKNPAIRKLIEEAKATSGLKSQHELGAAAENTDKDSSTEAKSSSGENRQQQLLERLVHKLEQHNIALVAENFEQRRQLKDLRLQMGREDMMIETGRRVPAPPACL